MDFGGTNLDQAHAYNRHLILEAIRVHGPLSRADLTRLTGLAPQTISNICATLTKAGLVLARKRAGTLRGQPPIDLELNPGGGYAFGISIANDRLFVVLVDIVGNRLAERAIRLPDRSPSAALSEIRRTVGTLKAHAAIAEDRILGAGLAMTGLTTHGGFIGLAPDESTRHWRGLSLERELTAALSMPIFTDNDARAAAIGEALYGRGRKYRNFVYIYFGVGVGGGIVHTGQPFRGSQGRAGEFGHMIVAPGGRLCSCGNRGCLEQYASMASAFSAVGLSPGESDGEARLVEAFAAGHPGLTAWIDSAAVHLRTAVINLENVFDPETVLLGGIIPEPLLDAIYDRILPLPRSVAGSHDDVNRLVKSSFGPAIPAMGAAALALFDATSADLSLLFKKNAMPRPIVGASAS